MKKLKLILFTLFIGLLFTVSVSAASYKFSCEYENNNFEYNGILSPHTAHITYETNGDKTKIIGCEYTYDILIDYKFDANGNSFDFKGDKNCPSSFDINGNTIIWKSDTKGLYKKKEGSKEFVNFTSSIQFQLYKYIEDINSEISNINSVSTDKTKVYSCQYSKDNGPAYKLYFAHFYNNKIYLAAIQEIKNCSTYTFNTNGHYSKNSNSCPGSVNISENTIAWIGEGMGDYKYTGERTKSESTGATTPCYNFHNETNCLNSKDYACVWTKNKNAPNGKGFCNVDNLLYVGCGGASDIPVQVPALISFAVNLLKIATPIILIFISIISLLKALAAQKDDEIKKAQSSLVKKIIAAALVFFVVSIVQFVVSKVGTQKEVGGFSNCLKCFLNNDCKLTTYYKTNVSGEDYCTSFGTAETKLCDDLFEESFEE